MFSGIIEREGTVVAIADCPGGKRLSLDAGEFGESLKLGDSLAVNGACLTVSRKDEADLGFDIIHQTLEHTNLGCLKVGDPVNLERPLIVGGRLHGHFVLGHIDASLNVIDLRNDQRELRIAIELPGHLKSFVINKGSVALNGISLTVADLHEDSFEVCVIPHTCRVTNLNNLQKGQPVNVEFDMLGKYALRASAEA